MSEKSAKEQFHDKEIMPALLDLMKKANANGISMVAVTEWAPGESCRTHQLVDPHGVAMFMVYAAARAAGNADALIMALMRHAEKHGHGSLCLARLGVPEKPAAESSTGAP